MSVHCVCVLVLHDRFMASKEGGEYVTIVSDRILYYHDMVLLHKLTSCSRLE